ncbi:MAG: carbohydrate ABC transporter permease [bacterium]
MSKIKNKLLKLKANIDFLKWIGSILRGLFIISVSFIIIRPLIINLLSALMSSEDLYDLRVNIVPRNFTLDNFAFVFEQLSYPTAFLNSFLLATGIAVFTLVSCTIIGYGLARFEFGGRKVIFGLVILTLVVPPQIIMTPLYLNFRFFNLFGLLGEKGLNLLGSFWPPILLAITGNGLRSGLFIYIAMQFFRGMSVELEEASYVDGAGPVKTFFRVMLPNAVPILVIITLFAFVWQWNDLFYSRLFLREQTLLSIELRELPAIFSYGYAEKGEHPDEYISLLNNAGIILYITPVIILYGFMQRYFIQSVEKTGIVG